MKKIKVLGGDGAEGMLAMRLAGARTIAQDEAASIVFGMPRWLMKRAALNACFHSIVYRGKSLNCSTHDS